MNLPPKLDPGPIQAGPLDWSGSGSRSLPETNPKRHIWQVARGHSLTGGNDGKTGLKRYLLFGSLSMTVQSQTAPLAIWMVGGVIQECSLLGEYMAISLKRVIGRQSSSTCLTSPSGAGLFQATLGVGLLWPSDHRPRVMAKNSEARKKCLC